jgi:hypothetical protein
VYTFLFTIARTKPSKTPKVEKIDEAQESTVPEQEATGESESKNEATNKDDTGDKADTTDDTAKTKQETSPRIEIYVISQNSNSQSSYDIRIELPHLSEFQQPIILRHSVSTYVIRQNSKQPIILRHSISSEVMSQN